MEKTKEVETKALTIVEQAKSVRVADNQSYTNAGILWKQIGDMIKEVKNTFDPICEAANKAHKEATGKRAKFLDPLVSAQKSIKQLMSAYDAEQERLRLEEEKRLFEIAKKQEEERRLMDAIAAEEAGEIEEAETIIEEQEYVPPVVVQKSIPKMEGGPVYRTVWSAEVVSIKDLCRAVSEGKASPELVLPNMPALNKLAVALKDTLQVSGVKAVSRRV
jgi:hypothetical protein